VKLYEEIKKICVRKKLNVEFVPWDTPGIKKLLVLCGCPVDCAGRPGGTYQEIVVAGMSVDHEICSVDSIPKKVVAKLIREDPE